MEKQTVRLALQIVLLFALLALGLALLMRPPEPPRVTGDECPTVHTDAAPAPADVACWNRFAAVGVYICPTEAHPDWLTALAPVCPPD
jgi:hypothetical protein